MSVPPFLVSIFKASGLDVKKCIPVSGGDINKAFCVQTNESRFFLKVNAARGLPGMFSQEAQGLMALKETACLEVPGVIKTGICEGQQFLLLEWLERGQPERQFWELFGAGLACLHRRTNTQFGWDQDNYVGSLKQSNKWRKSWSEFYAEMRVMPLVVQLIDRGDFSRTDLQTAEAWCKRFTAFPVEPPSLLHGDLWSGNFMVSHTGLPAIFDPATYFGHREMDLGMSKLFGGFEPAFYEAYQHHYPLDKEWKLRLVYSQFYPLLVHAVLFGGAYVHHCRKTMLD
jgi:fructosamine-3-kinase